MSRCNQCQIEILDETEHCPLCHSVLQKSQEMEDSYPDIRLKAKVKVMFSNIYVFIAIAVELIFLGVCIYTGKWFPYALITGAVLFYVYTIIRYAILGLSNHRLKMLVATIVTILVLIIIDYLVGFYRWSVNYVLPLGILVMDAAILILIILNRKNWQSYIMLELFMVLCSACIFIVYWLHIMTTPFVAIIALYASILLFLGTVIMGGRKARVELKRRFHI